MFIIFKCFSSVLPTKIGRKIVVSKDAQYSETDYCVHEFLLAIFSFWGMVDFVFFLLTGGKNVQITRKKKAWKMYEIFANLIQMLTNQAKVSIK